MIKSILTLLFIACVQVAYSQSNETLVYSFKTDTNKEVVLAMDKNYIVYRFSTNDTVEFEYPGKTKESWKKFKYSYYLRGGGNANEGMDLNYIVFSNDDFQYVIYDTYYSANNETKIGVKVTDLKTKKTTDIKGDPKTRKGSLIDFRDNNLLEVGEEIFD